MVESLAITSDGTVLDTWYPTGFLGLGTVPEQAPTLPAGLTLNTSTGIISGNPGDAPGPYVVQLTASNSAGTSQPVQTLKDALVVPQNAIISNTRGTFVYTVAPDNTAKIANVERLVREGRMREPGLRQVELGYDIPQAILQKVRFTDTRIFVSGQNLLTFTKVENFDPERQRGVGSDQSTPLYKVISAGVNLKF